MTEGKLVFLQKGYRVVPEEPIHEMCKALLSSWQKGNTTANDDLRNAIKAAPPIDTPPVLRWEKGNLYIFGVWLAYCWKDSEDCWPYLTNGRGSGRAGTEQEARRAAEKALGFPDGLVVEEA